ncbi:MAG: 1-acyl-sn-glycerol-3-phosphate acyltransferase [Pseudomonadota bacterium]
MPEVHVVEQLLKERSEGLRRHPRLWRLLQRVLLPVLGYQRAIDLVDSVQGLSGPEVFRHCSDLLELRLEHRGTENIPETGRGLVVANHPAGIADGIAVWETLAHRREDITLFANRDAIRMAPGLAENIIPVEWLEENRTRERQRETVRTMVKAFRDERLVVIFPSGRLAYMTWAGLTERPWKPTAVNLAQKYDCPLIPMHIDARNSALFYFLSFVSDELRDITLFHELLNKTRQRYRMTIGEPIDASGDPKALTEMLKTYVTGDLAHGHLRIREPKLRTPEPATSA